MSKFIQTDSLDKALKIIKEYDEKGLFAEYVEGGVMVFSSLYEWKTWKNQK